MSVRTCKALIPVNFYWDYIKTLQIICKPDVFDYLIDAVYPADSFTFIRRWEELRFFILARVRNIYIASLDSALSIKLAYR
jgi:hypothetical protein